MVAYKQIKQETKIDGNIIACRRARHGPCWLYFYTKPAALNMQPGVATWKTWAEVRVMHQAR
jgi:hypothetical protein